MKSRIIILAGLVTTVLVLIIFFSIDLAHINADSEKVIERTYEIKRNENKIKTDAGRLFLGAHGGYICVFDEEDNVTHKTSIRLRQVPRELQIKILNKQRINNIYELYDLLETYSS